MTQSWWDESYEDIINWNISEDQYNPDRQAYKDAFQMEVTTMGLDYEITSGLMAQDTANTQNLMQTQADLERRNEPDSMTAQHEFNTDSMYTSQELSKDYLAAEGYQERETIAEQGYQSRELQKISEQGQTTRTAIDASSRDYASDAQRDAQLGSSYYNMQGQLGAAEYDYQGTLAQAQASRDIGLYAQDAESARRESELASAERQVNAQETGATTRTGIDAASRDYASDKQKESALGVADYEFQGTLAQTEAQKEINRYAQDSETGRREKELASAETQIGLKGNEDRSTTRVQGEENRNLVRTQGDESRRSLAYDRSMAYSMAQSGTRR